MSEYEVLYSSEGQCPKCGETMIYAQYDEWPAFPSWYICDPCNFRLTPDELEESEKE